MTSNNDLIPTVICLFDVDGTLTAPRQVKKDQKINYC